MMDCILPTLGYRAWTPEGYFSFREGCSVGTVIYTSLLPGANTNHSDCPPGPGNPNWAGPFSLEEINRGLELNKAGAI